MTVILSSPPHRYPDQITMSHPPGGCLQSTCTMHQHIFPAKLQLSHTQLQTAHFLSNLAGRYTSPNYSPFCDFKFRSRPDRDFRNRTGPDRIGTPDPVDRTGLDRIPDQDIDFFCKFCSFFFYFSCLMFLIFEFEQKNHSGYGIDNLVDNVL